MSTKCPCHSNLEYNDCCGPYHKGQLPETALQLMRSRYAAYALGLVDYICATETKPSSKDSIEQFFTSTKFLGLTILSSADDTVSFEVDTDRGSWQERSHFINRDGRWLFITPFS